jgi:2-methylcitrate dehydratase PrpD
VLGCAIAASGTAAATSAQGVAERFPSGGSATVIGLRAGYHPTTAALANGTLAHALDFDDTHTGSIAHISAVVVPAVLAVGEASGATGAEALAAIVLGSETVTRVGAVGAPTYMQSGFHPTSVAGVFGAAAAAARILGLTPEETAHALGIAGSMASGIFEYLGDGSTTKAMHAGWAAHCGIMATMLASAGGHGPARVLEGRFGVFATHFRLTPEHIDDWDLGIRWESSEISSKPYPACHFLHSSLDAGRALRDEGLDPSDITDIVVKVPPPAVPLVLEPSEHKRAPRTPYEAKFSLQYSLAAMLRDGRVGLDTYEPERISEPETLALAARVRFVAAEMVGYPDVFPATVTVTTGRKQWVATRPLGGRPTSPEPRAVCEKFRSNAKLALEPDDVATLESRILSLETAGTLAHIVETLRRARRGP